jgi:hypothetical protein
MMCTDNGDGGNKERGLITVDYRYIDYNGLHRLLQPALSPISLLLGMDPSHRYRSAANHPTPSTATSNGSASPVHRGLSPSAASPEIVQEIDEEGEQAEGAADEEEVDRADIDSLADADDSQVEARALAFLEWQSEGENEEGKDEIDEIDWQDSIFLPRYEEGSPEGIGELQLHCPYCFLSDSVQPS